MDPQISSFCEQPLKAELFFQEDMKVHYSIPDMIVEDNNHELTLIEVKHRDQLKEDKVKKQIKIQKEWANNHGMSHKIFTDDILHERYRLNTWKIIIQAVSSSEEDLVASYINMIINSFPSNSSTTIGEIIATVDADTNQVITAIYHLIYFGRMELSKLNDVISSKSEVLIYG